MPLLSISLLLILFGTFYFWLRHYFSYWARRSVLHEKPYLLLGNVKGIGREVHWKDINQRIYEKFKNTRAPFVGFFTFFSKAAFLLDLDLIKQVMVRDFATFPNRGLFHNVRDDPLTGNLLFLDGEQWRHLRHKLSPVFTSGRLRYTFPTMATVGQSLSLACEKLLLDSSSVIKAAEFEAKELCARYTTDAIGSCAFGIECNSLTDSNAKFRCMGRDIFEKPRHSSFVQAFMFSHPGLARNLRMKFFSDEASDFFLNVVRQTVALREDQQIQRNDFMNLLIELKRKGEDLNKNSIDDTDDLSNVLTLEQLAAQALIFFLAGFETSSTTMSFCMYELALNPDIQQTLREEMLNILRKYEGELSYESVKEMIYLDMVIAETLRKYSVQPHLVRQAINDYPVPNTRYVIERGTDVIIPIHAIHHDPSLFPEPQKFDPERFSPEECARRHSSAYLPFGDGPRNCIGMRFGKLQVKIGIIKLLQHYRLTTTAKTQIPLRFSKKNFFIAAAGGIHLGLEKL